MGVGVGGWGWVRKCECAFGKRAGNPTLGPPSPPAHPPTCSSATRCRCASASTCASSSLAASASPLPSAAARRACSPSRARSSWRRTCQRVIVCFGGGIQTAFTHICMACTPPCSNALSLHVTMHSMRSPALQPSAGPAAPPAPAPTPRTPPPRAAARAAGGRTAARTPARGGWGVQCWLGGVQGGRVNGCRLDGWVGRRGTPLHTHAKTTHTHPPPPLLWSAVITCRSLSCSAAWLCPALSASCSADTSSPRIAPWLSAADSSRVSCACVCEGGGGVGGWVGGWEGGKEGGWRAGRVVGDARPAPAPQAPHL